MTVESTVIKPVPPQNHIQVLFQIFTVHLIDLISLFKNDNSYAFIQNILKWIDECTDTSWVLNAPMSLYHRLFGLYPS
jgi:hypothetical protein